MAAPNSRIQSDTRRQPYASHILKLYENGVLSNRLPVIATNPNGLEEQARKAMEEKGFKYIYGDAGELSTMDANRLAFRQWKIIPRVLKPTNPRDLTVELFGAKYGNMVPTRLDSPILMAPVGVQGMFHKSGERGLIGACTELGVPYTLSTAATSSIESIGEFCGSHPHWYQLYWPKENDITQSLLLRAKHSGFSTLVVTLDTVTVAWRPHDLDIANLPFLEAIGNSVGFSDPVFRDKFRAKAGKTPEEDKLGASRYWMSEIFTAEHHTWEDLKLLRENWDKTTIMFDSGIRTGSDIIKALALGAQAVFVGRPALYGLGIAGEEGAYEVLAGLLAEMDQCMAIAGFKTISELKKSILRKVQY
ncbi:oxidoreductase [Ilyonectria sp. MPI-CAGE-AT-0026]|nr:oxidoreductase [Ilyonectria sp. MPI-CAGE-AT-0026]